MSPRMVQPYLYCEFMDMFQVNYLDESAGVALSLDSKNSAMAASLVGCGGSPQRSVDKEAKFAFSSLISIGMLVICPHPNKSASSAWSQLLHPISTGSHLE